MPEQAAKPGPGARSAKEPFLSAAAIKRILDDTALPLLHGKSGHIRVRREISSAAETLVRELMKVSPPNPKAMLNDLGVIYRKCSYLLKYIIGVNPFDDELPSDLLVHLSSLLPDYPAPALRGLVEVAGRGDDSEGIRQIARLADNVVAILLLSMKAERKYQDEEQQRVDKIARSGLPVIALQKNFIDSIFSVYFRSFGIPVGVHRNRSNPDEPDTGGGPTVRFVQAVFQEIRHRVSESPSLKDLKSHKALKPTRAAIAEWIRDHHEASTRPERPERRPYGRNT